MHKYLSSIATVLIMAIFISFLIPLTIGVAYFLHRENRRLETELNVFLNTSLESMTEGVSEAIRNFEPNQAENAARLIIRDPRIMRVTVYSSLYGMTMANLEKNPDKPHDQLIVEQHHIRDDDAEIGYVEIAIDKTFYDATTAKARTHVMILFAGMFVCGLTLVGPIIYFYILKPLGKLIQQAETLSSGNMETAFIWERQDELSQLGKVLETMRQKLQLSFMKIEKLAVTDELTHMPNRRAFFTDAGKTFASAKRYERPLSLALLDIDHFKSVNDHYGHDMGDTVLREVAEIIMQSMRNSDLCARYGGEEFVICMPETTLAEGRIAAEKIRKNIQKYTFSHGQKVTMSIGIAENSPELSLDVLINRADQAMYQAKKNGRNQVVRFNDTA